MFPYTDPVKANFLGKSQVQENYRRILDREYDRTASRLNSAITWLEAFDQVRTPGRTHEPTVVAEEGLHTLQTGPVDILGSGAGDPSADPRVPAGGGAVEEGWRQARDDFDVHLTGW